ncbi:MAG: TonB-dependent receptor [Flavobacteriia bacterium]|nr:TonB-dependent receptor [Flavobacteriia bacterium]
MLSRLFIVPMLLVSVFSAAQTVVTLASEESKSPITWTQVTIEDSATILFSTGTNNWGSFIFPVELFGAADSRKYTLKAAEFQPITIIFKKGESPLIYLKPVVATLEEFIVTGQFSAVSTEHSIQKARVIDRAVMDAKGAVNLRDVLQSELNIRISQDQVLGSGMSLQGMNGQNVKILIDGVPVIGRVDGEIDLSQINLSNVERIEIIEGPSSVSFGSNALAGTINLITKKREKAGQDLQLNSYVESVGSYNLDGRLTTNVKRSQIQVYGLRNYFDGWINGDPFVEFPKEKVADSGRYQTWKPKLNYQVGVKWTIPIKRLTITPYADGFYEQIHSKGLPRAPYFNTAFDDYYTTNRINEGILIDAPLKNRFKLNGVFAHNDYERIKNTYLKNLNTLDQQLTTTPGDQDTTRFYALMSRLSLVKYQRDSAVNVEVGYDINRETAVGRRIVAGKQTITEAALFANTEIQLRNWSLKPGLRYTYNSAYRSAVTPALNLKYTLRKWTFRAGVASGFRSPAIKELYIDFVDINHNIQGNTNLKPEQSMHYQMWVSTKRKLGKHPLTIDMNGYYQQVKQKISLAQDPSGVIYSYFNLDHFEAIGVQAMADMSVGKQRFKVGAAYVGTKSNLTLNGYAFSPEITASMSVFWKKPQITWSAFYKYTGRVIVYLSSEESELVTSFMNDYNMLDISASKPFWSKHMVLTCGAKNLFNVRQVGAGNGPGAHSGSATSTPVGWGRSGSLF